MSLSPVARCPGHTLEGKAGLCRHIKVSTSAVEWNWHPKSVLHFSLNFRDVLSQKFLFISSHSSGIALGSGIKY